MAPKKPFAPSSSGTGHPSDGTQSFRMERDWFGKALGSEFVSRIDLSWSEKSLNIVFSSPYFGDSPPATPEGPTWELWNYEVIEFFFLGEDEEYLEVEIAPKGHYLVLQLKGKRNIVQKMLPLKVTCNQTSATHWEGKCEIPRRYLPGGLSHWNAFAIHGKLGERHYHALFPGTQAPDFHQFSCYEPILEDPWAQS